MTEKTPDPATMSDEEVIPSPSTTPKPDEQAPSEPAEEAKGEEAEAEVEEPTEDEEKKPKTSGYARLKARHQRVLAELEALRRPQHPPEPEVKEPKIEDFNGDYLAFEKASVAYSAERAVERALAKQAQQASQKQEAEFKHEAIEDFFERTEEVKAKLKDFDSAIDQMYGQFGPLPEVVRDQIAKADNGPQILYYLAKNPSAARELYESGPLDALYTLGRLDEKMSLPSARKETKAPPIINAPKGGATPPKDFYQLASKSEDISDYVRARRKDRPPEE